MLSVYETAKKATALIKLLCPVDDLRGLHFTESDIIIAFGYRGMGSTTSTIIINKETFFNKNLEEIMKEQQNIERPNPSWNYISIEEDNKVYKKIQGLDEIFEIITFEDFDFINE